MRHSTTLTNKVGQFSGCTSFGANHKAATETRILMNSHDMNLTAKPPGVMYAVERVTPQAIKAEGSTIAPAPIKADAITVHCLVKRPATATTTKPMPACQPTRPQGDRVRREDRKACTS